MLRGGGKSFGPHPRDFATALPRKVYDLAWRTALSWRYRKGQLVICEDGMDLDYSEEEYARTVFERNQWGKEFGKSLVVTTDRRDNLFQAIGNSGKARTIEDVDVKNLLEMGKVIIEKSALDQILAEHESDLISKVRSAV
jgi:large subunit ribosomal protein L4